MIIPAPARYTQADGEPFALTGPIRLAVRGLPEPVPTALADLRDALSAAGALVLGEPPEDGETGEGEEPPEGRDSGADEPREISLELTGGTPDALPLSAQSAEGEAYRLVIAADRIALHALAPTGLAYGLRTLTELVRGADEAGQNGLAPAEITDAPRYPWRGLSLDVVRHFFDVDAVREVIDLLASVKMNALHLHLSDDQAWRLELASRPRLTEVTGHGQVDDSLTGDSPHEVGRGGGEPGFYSRADWESILDHAAARGVTIIPEFDVPGHTHAALVAYPELTADGEQLEPYSGTRVGFSQITLHQQAAEPFLRDVFDELAEITPGPYLHGGGDEAQVTTKEDYREVLGLLGQIVQESGKVLVVWQEAAQGDLPEDAVVQYWSPGGEATDAVVEAARRGHDILMSPGDRVYLDMKYDEDFPLGLTWAGTVDVAASYDWDPGNYLDGVPADQVRGVEAAVWTETLTNSEELFRMLLPRLAAAAEVAWSPQEVREESGFEGFASRLAALAPQWQRRGWAFHRSAQIDWS
ncbi:hexosaminidase [Bogoriella caseilytica]|uniref:beta-N-acetylhexosaminidase n=1 Tax=Bogoriella caseilytica TaxID=56055 RepID=A0A3N2BAT5_9MICO|nr:hexosaminidase [Bogoriella caseilytica]